jgi:uncharacterized membrane protein YtjA (UPF0391 family)
LVHNETRASEGQDQRLAKRDNVQIGTPIAELRAVFVTTTTSHGGRPMLRLAIAFLVVALISGLFGFGLVAGTAIEAAKIIFFVFIVLCVLSFLAHGFRQGDAW